MKNNEEKTREKLEQLSLSLGDIKVKSRDTKSINMSFRTSEVVILLLIAAIVSLIMGGVVTYNLSYANTKKVDEELQNFIQNYEYIVDNYYGEVDKSELLDSAIAGMLESLDINSSYVGATDSNFIIFLEGSYEGTGIQVYNNDENNVEVAEVFEGSVAEKAGIKAGDVIIKLNDVDVKGMDISDFSSLVKEQKDNFKLTYLRDGEEYSADLKVGQINIQSVSSKIINKDDNKIGYVAVSIFANNTPEQFESAINKLEKENIDGLIIDLRDNSGGHLSSAHAMISMFLDDSHTVYQIKSKDNQTKYYSAGDETKDYPITVLVNENSASASEIMASALQEQYGATLVGTTTYGKGTVQEMQTLADGNQYKLTTKTWLTSKGKEVDGIGITPDVEIEISDDYRYEPTEENDNQLAKAIDEVLKDIKS